MNTDIELIGFVPENSSLSKLSHGILKLSDPLKRSTSKVADAKARLVVASRKRKRRVKQSLNVTEMGKKPQLLIAE